MLYGSSSNTCSHRVPMNLEHRRKPAVLIPLVAARQVPRDRQTDPRSDLEHDAIAALELLGGHPSAERIVDVRVGTGLVDEQIAVSETRHERRQIAQIRLGARRPGPVLPTAVVIDPVDAETIDDVLTAVALVLIEIEACKPPACAYPA